MTLLAKVAAAKGRTPTTTPLLRLKWPRRNHSRQQVRICSVLCRMVECGMGVVCASFQCSDQPKKKAFGKIKLTSHAKICAATDFNIPLSLLAL